jgi:hypothetical protein
MTHGILAYNASGSVILDDVLPYTPLIASGSTTATAWFTGNPGGGFGQFVSYGVTTQNALLFVRPRVTGAFVAVGQITNSGFRFKADDGVILDWRLYAANGVSDWVADNSHGLSVFSATGALLYSTNKYPPFIRGTDVVISDDSTYTGNDNAFIKNIAFGFTAYDDGIPFVSAHTLTYRYFVYGSQTQIGYCLAANWSSTTACSFYWKRYYSTGLYNDKPISAPTGDRPVKVLVIR